MQNGKRELWTVFLDYSSLALTMTEQSAAVLTEVEVLFAFRIPPKFQDYRGLSRMTLLIIEKNY